MGEAGWGWREPFNPAWRLVDKELDGRRGVRRRDEMRISEREIGNALRLLSQPPMDEGGRALPDARTTRLVFDRLRELPDVRREMVAPLKAAVRESRYHVSGDEVARMLLGRCLADSIR